MADEVDEIPSCEPPQEPPPIFAPPPLPARPPRKSSSNAASTSSDPMVNLPPRIKDPSLHDLENEQDIDEEISAQMTASYSEISFNSDGNSVNSDCDTAVSLSLEQLDSPLTIPDLPEHIKQRPISLQYENQITPTNPTSTKLRGASDVSGTIHVDGSNMTYYVAEDLEYKIKLSSPIAKKSDNTPFPGTSSRNGTPSNNLYRQILTPQFTQVDVNLLTDLECEAQRMATSIDNLTENLGGILHSMSSITADNVDIYKDAVSKMSDAMDSNIKGMYTIIAKAEEVSHTMKNVQYHAERIKEIKRLVDLFESNL